MTLRDHELGQLTDTELSHLARCHHQAATAENREPTEAALAVIAELRDRALAIRLADENAQRYYRTETNYELRHALSNVPATHPKLDAWTIARRARLMVNELHGRALAEDQHRRAVEIGCYAALRRRD